MGVDEQLNQITLTRNIISGMELIACTVDAYEIFILLSHLKEDEESKKDWKLKKGSQKIIEEFLKNTLHCVNAENPFPLSFFYQNKSSFWSNLIRHNNLEFFPINYFANNSNLLDFLIWFI